MFRTRLELFAEPLPDEWSVAAPLIWLDDRYGLLTVPVGTHTDLASIPRILRNLPFLDPCGFSRRPAVVHDYLYRSEMGHYRGKAFADNFLFDALIAEGCSLAVARVFYYAVRLFGGDAWDAAPAADRLLK